MAGIVATTLRRRTFRQKLLSDAKRPSGSESGQLSITASDSFQKLPSFYKKLTKSALTYACQHPKGWLLHYEDFWPSCLNPAEKDLSMLLFEQFDVLVARANEWLQDNTLAGLVVVKCETVERQICCVAELTADMTTTFRPTTARPCFVTGLRLWVISLGSELTNHETEVAPEIGYVNVIPRRLGLTADKCHYEDNATTCQSINAYLRESPVEGKIVTVETIAVRLARNHCPIDDTVCPDRTLCPGYQHDSALYITRIFFIRGAPDEEIIGVQDFLPDFSLSSACCPCPTSTSAGGPPLASAMTKARQWVSCQQNLRVTNVQTLETVYNKQADGGIDTGITYLTSISSRTLVSFVRILYVQPADRSLTCRLMYTPPGGFSYKTFVPSAVKVAMCSGTPQYEPFTTTWKRSRAWLKAVDLGIVSIQSIRHPLSLLWHEQDQGESTVLPGDWLYSRHQHTVSSIRVYLDGDYTEPSPDELPLPPVVHEVNDCCCSLM